MNAGPILTLWLQLLGLLAVEVALVVGVAALISRFVASPAWRRTVWQVCFLGLLALTLSELTGTARNVVSWLARLENRFAARTTAANQSSEQPASGRLTEVSHKKLATQLAPVNQDKAGETAEATSLVIQPLDAKTQPAPAPTDTRPQRNPANRAGAGGDSVADSLVILWLELIWLMGALLVVAPSCLAHVLLALFRRQSRPYRSGISGWVQARSSSPLT